MSHCEKSSCPKCGVSWEDEREMPQVLFESQNTSYKTIEEAEVAAALYGWTKENKMKPGKDVIGVQYSYKNPNHYDGVSEWNCAVCKARVGRWSGKLLEEGQYEPRFGGM